MVRIVGRKPHPSSPEHEVVVFETRVRHELQIPRGAAKEEVRELIRRYLKGYDTETPEGKVHVPGYEDIYPETREKEPKESVISTGSPSGSGE
ncbi:MAG: hypothetical protein QXK01_08925 [Thermofilum sp.]|uniref:hypothetical protein n=1 Tax=Thermofilum sp. TaxID=1961369 RepID=UPI003168BB10